MCKGVVWGLFSFKFSMSPTWLCLNLAYAAYLTCSGEGYDQIFGLQWTVYSTGVKPSLMILCLSDTDS